MSFLIPTIAAGLLTGLSGKQKTLARDVHTGRHTNLISNIAGAVSGVLGLISNDDNMAVDGVAALEVAAFAKLLNAAARLIGDATTLSEEAAEWMSKKRGEARGLVNSAWANFRSAYATWSKQFELMPPDEKSAEAIAAAERVGDQVNLILDLLSNLHPGHTSGMTADEDIKAMTTQKFMNAKFVDFFEFLESVPDVSHCSLDLASATSAQLVMICGGVAQPRLRNIPWSPASPFGANLLDTSFDGVIVKPPTFTHVANANMQANSDIFLSTSYNTDPFTYSALNDKIVESEAAFMDALRQLSTSQLSKPEISFSGGTLGVGATYISTATQAQLALVNRLDGESLNGEPIVTGTWKFTTRGGRSVERNTGCWRVWAFRTDVTRTQVTNLSLRFKGQVECFLPYLHSEFGGLGNINPLSILRSDVNPPQSVMLMLMVDTPMVNNASVELLAGSKKFQILAAWEQQYETNRVHLGTQDSGPDDWPFCERVVVSCRSMVSGAMVTVPADKTVILVEFFDTGVAHFKTRPSTSSLYYPATAMVTFTPKERWSSGRFAYGGGTNAVTTGVNYPGFYGSVDILQHINAEAEGLISAIERKLVTEDVPDQGGRSTEVVPVFSTIKTPLAGNWGRYVTGGGITGSSKDATSIGELGVGDLSHALNSAGMREKLWQRGMKFFNDANPSYPPVIQTFKQYAISDEAFGRRNEQGQLDKNVLHMQLRNFFTKVPNNMSRG